MIQHFIYGLFNYAGYQLLKTPLVDQLLSQQHIRNLMHIGNHATQEELHRTWFPNEQILAYSLIIPRRDSFGRTGVWNHTLLLTYADYLHATEPNAAVTKLHDLFIREPVTPMVLHPLEVST